MNTQLLYSSGNYRSETDENIITNLIRKGWVVVPAPPVIDEANFKYEYVVSSNDYNIIPLSDEEKAQYEQRIVEKQQADNRNEKLLIIQNGFTVQPENITLSLFDADRNAFAQLIVLIREALELGLINSLTPQTIKDKNGESHTLTTARLQQVIIQYGFYYKTIWETL